MNRSAIQRAENESTFRRANEDLEQKAQSLSFRDQPTPYLCECDDERCTQVVLLTGEEYEQVRARPRTFLLVADHQSPDDRVVRTEADYIVIEKTGEKGALVEQRYPRR